MPRKRALSKCERTKDEGLCSRAQSEGPETENPPEEESPVEPEGLFCPLCRSRLLFNRCFGKLGIPVRFDSVCPSCGLVLMVMRGSPAIDVLKG